MPTRKKLQALGASQASGLRGEPHPDFDPIPQEVNVMVPGVGAQDAVGTQRKPGFQLKKQLLA